MSATDPSKRSGHVTGIKSSFMFINLMFVGFYAGLLLGRRLLNSGKSNLEEKLPSIVEKNKHRLIGGTRYYYH